ncbi:9722_t:CDS:2 [Entrophospora sp. SA101]|nr:9722_t:CDS:2 [Entrophospora sp. SA101]CAJ0835999.1 13469_t:CDS:2 [Entrophospora sp. SA101]
MTNEGMAVLESKVIEYFWDKGHQYYNTNNEVEDGETIQKEPEPDSSNKEYKGS